MAASRPAQCGPLLLNQNKGRVMTRFPFRRFTRFACVALPFSAALLCGAAMAQKSSAAADKLKVYFVDVEGGQATLFVTPAHESLLIDTGWPEHGGRDADRIVAA